MTSIMADIRREAEQEILYTEMMMQTTANAYGSIVPHKQWAAQRKRLFKGLLKLQLLTFDRKS
jgi:hypothetical protein